MTTLAPIRKPCKSIYIVLFHLILTQQLLAQPIVSGFSPTSGAVGTVVTITGTNFSAVAGNNTVYFGATKASVTAATVNALTVVVPAGATYEPLTVTTNGLTAYAARPFVVTFPGGAAITPWSFDPGTIAAGVSPNDVVSSDVDGDGKADMIVLNGGYPYSISVYRNTSSGSTISFAPKVDFNTGEVPVSIATGDIDGDGKTDLAVANFFSFSISVFRNRSTPGNISFGRTDIPAHIPDRIVIGDLNNDGKPDMAATNMASGTVSLFKNMGSPGVIAFAAKVDYPTAKNPTSLCIGDLDGDQWKDIVVSADAVSIFKNNGLTGSLSFTITGGINTSATPGEIAVADIDGDSKADINLITGSKAIAVYRNTGSPGNIAFATPTSFQSTTYAADLRISDMDGDGSVDFVIADGANSIGILRNTSTTGAVTFDGVVNVPTETPADHMTIADYNGDQKPDIATANQSENSVTFYRNRIDEPTIVSFSPTQSPAGGNITITGVNLSGVTAVTFGNVAAQSFSVASSTTIHAVVGSGASGDVNVTGATGTGIAKGFIFFPAPQITSFTPGSAYAGEEVTINGKYFTGATAVTFGGTAALSFSVVSDNVITAIVGEGSSGAVSVTTPGGTVSQTGFTYLVSTIAPVITSFTPVTGPIGTTVTITGNYFGASTADNIVYFGATRATVLSATATSLTVQVPSGASYQPITVTTNRLTAQTQVPFVVTYPSAGPAFTAGSFGNPEVVNPNNASWVMCSPDINGDGKPDLIHSFSEPATIRVLKNTSTGNTVSFNEFTDLPGLKGTPKMATADMDGDGKTDIVAVHYGTPYDPHTISIRKNISSVNTIAFAPAINIPAGASGSLVVSDLDLDGRPDVVVTSIPNNVFSIYKNTSNGNLISLAGKIDYATGSSGTLHVSAGDIDGDGRPEIITTNWQARTISIYRNTSTPGNISLASPIVMSVDGAPFGTDISDYDGDEKPEIAVMHKLQNNAVFVHRNISTVGAIAFAPKLRIDLPAEPVDIKPGDLDGDGKPDMAVVINHYLIYIKNRSEPGILSFAPGVKSGYLGNPGEFTIADFDGDSRSDITTGAAILRNQVGAARLEPVAFDPVPTTTMNRSVVDASVQTYNGTPYVQRHYDVVPATNAGTAKAIVTLYFTQQEFDNYNAHPGHGPDLPKNPADETNKANLRIYQFHGESTTFIPGSYSGLGVIINPDDAKIVWNSSAACWEVTFDVNGFSGFFAASVGFIKPVTPPVVTPNGNLSVCQGQPVLLTSSVNANNQWYKSGVAINGATAATYNVTTAGAYTVTTVSNGILSDPSNVVVVDIKPVPAKPKITQIAFTLYSSAVVDSYNQWYRDGVLIPGATSSIYSPEKSGNYSVIATWNGCASPESDKHYFGAPVTGIVNIDNTQFIKLSPNPVADQVQLTFNLSNTLTVNIQLIDMRGQVIALFNHLSNGSQINCSGIATGIYLAKIFNPKNKKYYIIKVLKQ
jgi:hypothetical protein